MKGSCPWEANTWALRRPSLVPAEGSRLREGPAGVCSRGRAAGWVRVGSGTGCCSRSPPSPKGVLSLDSLSSSVSIWRSHQRKSLQAPEEFRPRPHLASSNSLTSSRQIFSAASSVSEVPAPGMRGCSSPQAPSLQAVGSAAPALWLRTAIRLQLGALSSFLRVGLVLHPVLQRGWKAKSTADHHQNRRMRALILSHRSLPLSRQLNPTCVAFAPDLPHTCYLHHLKFTFIANL